MIELEVRWSRAAFKIGRRLMHQNGLVS